jgi:hypothetical protein
LLILAVCVYFVFFANMALRPYPAAAWAAAGPYPGEVSVDSFGAKMEHRSVSDLYAGDVDPVTQAVSSPVRRVSPNGVLADPLWRCSRYGEVRSYNDYPAVKTPGLPAPRRNLDGPAYELTAYARHPLDFPLTKPGYLFDPLKSPYYDENLYRRHRRFGYLDDPLYPSRTALADDALFLRSPYGSYLDDPLSLRSPYGSYLDDPLYRRSDPLYRRTALVDDPLFRRSDPLYRRAAYIDGPAYRRGALDDPVFGRGRSLLDRRVRSASPLARVPVV